MAVRKTKRHLTAKEYALAALLIVILIWLIYLNVSIYHKEQIAQKAARDSAAQLASLQTREKSLQSNVNELSTERGQEAVLRETYGVALPGEGVIIVVPPQAASTTPPESFWQKWFGWLKFW